MAEADVGVLLCRGRSHRHRRLRGGLHGPGRLRPGHRGAYPPARPFLLGLHRHGRPLTRQLLDFRRDVPLDPHLPFRAPGFPPLSPPQAHPRIHFPLLLGGGDDAGLRGDHSSDNSSEEALDYQCNLHRGFPTGYGVCALAVSSVSRVHGHHEIDPQSHQESTSLVYYPSLV